MSIYRTPYWLKFGILFFVLCLSNALWAAADQVILADDPVPQEEKDWYIKVAPHVWISGVKGTVGARGHNLDINLKPSDLRDFNEELDVIAQLQFEFKKGKWGFFIEPSYLSLTYATTILDSVFDNAQVVSPIRVVFSDFGGLYEVARFPSKKKPCAYRSVDVLGGIRYYKLRATVYSPIADLNARGEDSWVDPIVGARYNQTFGKRWSMWLRGDIGGFNLKNSSRFAWNLFAMASYKFNPHGAFSFGVRALNVDYKQSSNDDAFNVDMRLWGPVLGLNFSW